MNIFYTNKCPIQCAKYLDTKRVNKMILESAQMLCTALRECGYSDSILYKSTHRNHPSNVWVRQSRANYEWLLAHLKALSEEYYTRRGKWHKSYEKLYKTLSEASIHIPQGSLTAIPNCAANKEKGVSYKHIDDTCMAYQLYLADRWESDKREPRWD